MEEILANTLIRASQLTLAGLGLTLTFRILGFANFAHGELALLGAYFGYFFYSIAQLGLFLSVVLSGAFTGLAAVFCDIMVFRKCRNASDITLMIVSFGLSIVLQNIVLTIAGPSYRQYGLLQPSIAFLADTLNVMITPIQLGQILSTIIGLFILYLIMYQTKLGRTFRAVASNRSLAESKGVNVESVIKWTWFMGGVYAGVGGTFLGMDTITYPALGNRILLALFAAVILGGIGKPQGVILGALVVSFGENFIISEFFSDIISLGGLIKSLEIQVPAAYKELVAFFILIVVLLIKPTGLFGEKK